MSVEAWDTEKRPVCAGYNPDLVQRYCVREHSWQQFRLSLKGATTAEKLERLANWFDGKGQAQEYTRFMREVQVGNYLGALRRGGQLDMDNRIKRAR